MVGNIPFDILTGYFSNFQLINIFKIKLYRNLVPFSALEETDGYNDRKNPNKEHVPSICKVDTFEITFFTSPSVCELFRLKTLFGQQFLPVT